MESRAGHTDHSRTATIMHLCCVAVLLHLISFTGATGSGIVDGKVAKLHSRPYMVSLQVREHHVCGGFLIREDFVLTAAHCLQQQMSVILGAHNITKKEASQQRIEVADYHRHPKYMGEYSYDIMLLKLKTKATLNKYVKVIELPKKDKKLPANIECDVAGWGRPGPRMESSDVLLETKVKLQFDKECKYKWQKYFFENQMLCTHSGKKKGGICQGDSGGPLIYKGKAQGLSAYTEDGGCDNPKMPHVFIKVAFFLPWMKKVMTGREDAAPNAFK